MLREIPVVCKLSLALVGIECSYQTVWQSIFTCHWDSSYHICARSIFDRQKLKYLTEPEIYLFVSTFIYFHNLCLREALNLVCLGVWVDLSKCSLLVDAVTSVCRPNMSTTPKPFSTVIAYPRYKKNHQQQKVNP